MVLTVDAEQGRMELSTKQLEKTKGDMLRDKKLVYEGAEEMARLYLEKNKTPPAPRTKKTGNGQDESGSSHIRSGIDLFGYLSAPSLTSI